MIKDGWSVKDDLKVHNHTCVHDYTCDFNGTHKADGITVVRNIQNLKVVQFRIEFRNNLQFTRYFATS